MLAEPEDVESDSDDDGWSTLEEEVFTWAEKAADRKPVEARNALFGEAQH